MREITVFTHRYVDETRPTLERLASEAERTGVTLRLDEEETRKHRPTPQPGIELNAPVKDDVDLCVVLGGDGTILRALQRYAGTRVPVFAINFGEIGFLATVERQDFELGIRRALDGDFELLQLPAIVLDMPADRPDINGSETDRSDINGSETHRSEIDRSEIDRSEIGQQTAINDVAIHRKVGERVAEIAYALEGEVLGAVRCDGLVVATPAGSTGYSLANGGPVMAWGVEGFIVSFIAPHSLTARALVAAPGDRLTIENRSRGPLDVAVDGRPAGEIASGQTIGARFARDMGTIAQLPQSSFYRRLREKFGRLAS